MCIYRHFFLYKIYIKDASSAFSVYTSQTYQVVDYEHEPPDIATVYVCTRELVFPFRFKWPKKYSLQHIVYKMLSTPESHIYVYI